MWLGLSNLCHLKLYHVSGAHAGKIVHISRMDAHLLPSIRPQAQTLARWRRLCLDRGIFRDNYGARVKSAEAARIGIIATLLTLGLANHASADEPGRILAQVTSAIRFRHPGLLNTLAELREIRDRIAAGEEPWKSNFLKLQASPFARRDYIPHPSRS